MTLALKAKPTLTGGSGVSAQTLSPPSGHRPRAFGFLSIRPRGSENRFDCILQTGDVQMPNPGVKSHLVDGPEAGFQSRSEETPENLGVYNAIFNGRMEERPAKRQGHKTANSAGQEKADASQGREFQLQEKSPAPTAGFGDAFRRT